MAIPTDESDRLLLSRLAQKDRAALAVFYERFQRPVFGYLYRYFGVRELAEDVLQEVMLVAWQKAASFRGEGRVQSWVFGIAHRLATVALRREKGNLLELDTGITLPDAESMLEDSAIRKSAADELAAALASLTPVHREVLELAFYQDFSCKEIASIVGVPEGTVKSRLSYARRSLKAILLCQVEKE